MFSSDAKSGAFVPRACRFGRSLEFERPACKVASPIIPDLLALKAAKSCRIVHVGHMGHGGLGSAAVVARAHALAAQSKWQTQENAQSKR
eukprot:4089298-Pleurochrysis_carterae.AAC.1